MTKQPDRKNGYYLFEGKQLPSVTTILKSAGNAGGLINWGSKCGGRGVIWALANTKDGASLVDRLGSSACIEWADEQARTGLKLETERVTGFGTNVHRAIEHYLKKDTIEMELTKEEGECLETFKAFNEHLNFDVIDTEFVCINEQDRYAGRADFLTSLNEEQCLALKPYLKRNSDVPVPGQIFVDFKTGSLYAKSMAAQQSAYRGCLVDGGVCSGALIVGIDRDERDKVKCLFFNKESLDEAYLGFKAAYQTWLYFDAPQWYKKQWI